MLSRVAHTVDLQGLNSRLSHAEIAGIVNTASQKAEIYRGGAVSKMVGRR